LGIGVVLWGLLTILPANHAFARARMLLMLCTSGHLHQLRAIGGNA
jgi:hypothetical protein